MRKQQRPRATLPFPFWKYYSPSSSKMVVESFYSIKKEYSALDFVPIENEVKITRERSDTAEKVYLFLTFKKWSTLFFIGVSIGSLGAILSIIVEEMLLLKHKILSESLNDSLTLAYSFWAAVILIPIIISAFLLVYVEPSARGSGIPTIIAYLNGVNIERFSNARVAVIKYFTTILSGIANLPGGREEPFIHFGALFGASLATLKVPFTNWKPFSMYADPNGRRDLVTAGTAAAVAVAFGAPIGGILFCLEEGITFWNPGVAFLMFVCTIFSTFTQHLILAVYHEAEESLPIFNGYVFFKNTDKLDLTYTFSEMPIFILFGLLGAIIGTVWSQLHIVLHQIRSRLIYRKHTQLIEGVIFGILFVLICIVSFNIFDGHCTKYLRKRNRIMESIGMKYYCDETEFETIGLFLFQDLSHIMTSLFLLNREGSDDDNLFHYSSFYYLILSLIQNGTFLPSGVLIPNLIAGGAWGHVLGRLLITCGKEKCRDRAKYAFLGAVAQASGAAHLTLSLGMIMAESLGQTNFALPMFIVVLTAKWFGGLLAEPIFRTLCYLQGYPLIRAMLFPASTAITARTIMATPVVTMPMVIQSKEVVEFLRSHRHHNYPILSGKKVVGVITRRQILALLKTGTFKPPENEVEMRKQYKLFNDYEGESFTDIKKQIYSGKYEVRSGTLNFEKYMNPSPYMVHQDTTLKRLYLFFLALGASYVIVVDSNGDFVGIVTRKDIARYRRRAQLCLVRTEMVPII